MSTEAPQPDVAVRRAPNGRGLLREWLPMLVFLVLILVARSTLADHYHVPSGSMEGALMPGDHVVVNKSAFGVRMPFSKTVLLPRERPQPGDVVIFDSPEDGVRLIKRVVAVGGQEVAVLAGRVLINGVPLVSATAPTVERYGDTYVSLELANGGGPDLAPVRVPEGHVFVLGDHRGNSRDGRVFGFVREGELYGRAAGVIWRLSEGPTWHDL
ncbi:MAG: signal peptidase I [Pseudomonadota bacterium]